MPILQSWKELFVTCFRGDLYNTHADEARRGTKGYAHVLARGWNGAEVRRTEGGRTERCCRSLICTMTEAQARLRCVPLEQRVPLWTL